MPPGCGSAAGFGGRVMTRLEGCCFTTSAVRLGAGAGSSRVSRQVPGTDARAGEAGHGVGTTQPSYPWIRGCVVRGGWPASQAVGRPCPWMGRACVRPSCRWRCPMSSWRMLERVSLRACAATIHTTGRRGVRRLVGSLRASSVAPACRGAAGERRHPPRLRVRRRRRARRLLGGGPGLWRKRSGSKSASCLHIDQRVVRILRSVLSRACRAVPVRRLLSR